LRCFRAISTVICDPPVSRAAMEKTTVPWESLTFHSVRYA
jgi:hypothetical protein